MANKMAEVAKLLGVELNEDFEVEDTIYGTKYTTRVSHIGLENYHNNGCCGGGIWITNNAMLRELLVGSVGVRILRKPWKPKSRETYWTYNLNYFDVVESCWSDWAQEFAMLKCGAVFRTREEAVAARERVYKELTGKEWRET